MTVNEHKFETRAAMIDELYRVIVTELKRQSPATLLLSGGSTPGPLYRKLANADLDWEAISVALVDERWVEVDDDASNERLLRETLLVGNAAGANLVGMKTAAASALEGQAECETRYARLPRSYDICLLGMGADGHTASLFPHAEGLAQAIGATQHCAPIQALRSEVTGDQVERMTLTPWSILQSRRLILLFTGAEKWEIFQRACRPGAALDLPVRLFIHQQALPLEVYWAP